MLVVAFNNTIQHACATRCRKCTLISTAKATADKFCAFGYFRCLPHCNMSCLTSDSSTDDMHTCCCSWICQNTIVLS